MSELLLPLNGDAGPNDYTPTPAGLHFQNVDELVSDSDTTFLTAAASGEREVFSFDASVLADDDNITSMVIRTTWKPGANFGSWKAGFIIGGTDYFGSVHSDSGGDPYATTNDTWTTNPATSMPWTKAALAAARIVHEQVAFTPGLPRPRLTQCIPIANILTPAARPTGTPANTGPTGPVADPGSPEGTAAGVVPTADMVGLARSSSASASGTPRSALAGPRPTASPTAPGPSATASNPGQPTATGAPAVPTATHTHIRPTATPSIVLPPRAGAA